MPGSDRPRSERIRTLLEEVDRVCRESEEVASDTDHSMKQGAFWPDRRKLHRPASAERAREADDDGT